MIASGWSTFPVWEAAENCLASPSAAGIHTSGNEPVQKNFSQVCFSINLDEIYLSFPYIVFL